MTTAAAVLLVFTMRPNLENRSTEEVPAPDREGRWAVHTAPFPVPSEHLVLKTGMQPSRVEEVTASSWKITDDPGDPDLKDKLSVLSIDSLDDLL
jgi:hypothetical protein